MSLDTAEKNEEFAAAMGATTPVASDPDGKTARRYGVAGIGGLFARRWTFYIDGEGTLREIDKKVNPSSAGEDIVRKLLALDFPRLSSPVPPERN